MAPYSLDFDQKLEQPYAKLLAGAGNVRASLHAHDHSTKRAAPYEDGIEYLVIATVNKRTYAVISVWEGGFKIEENVF